MNSSFLCSDPLNGVARVMDTARRMGLHLNSLHVEKARPELYEIEVTLDETDPHLIHMFTARLDVLLIMERQASNV